MLLELFDYPVISCVGVRRSFTGLKVTGSVVFPTSPRLTSMLSIKHVNYTLSSFSAVLVQHKVADVHAMCFHTPFLFFKSRQFLKALSHGVGMPLNVTISSSSILFDVWYFHAAERSGK